MGISTRVQPRALGLCVPIPPEARACLFPLPYSDSKDSKDSVKNLVQSGTILWILNKRVLKIHMFRDITPYRLVKLPKLRRSWLHPSTGSEESKTSSWATQILQNPVTIYEYTSIRCHISQTLNQHRPENFRITHINSSCVLPETVSKKQGDQRNKKMVPRKYNFRAAY